MRKTTLVCLSVAVVLCSCFDLIASYVFYVSNPEFFVAQEANAEAISLFVDGVPPVMFLFNMILFPVMILVLLWWFEAFGRQTKDSLLLSRLAWVGSIVFIAGILLYCCSRISAGLTWYDGDTYLFNNLATVLHTMTMAALLGACGLMMTLYTKYILSGRTKATQGF